MEAGSLLCFSQLVMWQPIKSEANTFTDNFQYIWLILIYVFDSVYESFQYYAFQFIENYCIDAFPLDIK